MLIQRQAEEVNDARGFAKQFQAEGAGDGVNPWWTAATLGFLDGLRRHGWPGSGIRVLAYHGVLESQKDRLLERNFRLLCDFQSHLRFLRRYRVMNLAELVEELRHPKKRTRPAVVITFDDGYANNLLAAEVLAAFRLPWSLFIPTGAIGRDRFIWTSELSLLLLRGASSRLEALNKSWSMQGRREREFAFHQIRRALKTMPSASRRDAMDSLRRQFPEGETLRMLEEFPSMRMLSWKEIVQLQNSGVEIGSHGVDHEIQHAAQPESVRRFEQTESKAVLETMLATRCRYFAYPNGDFVATSDEEVRVSGYELAFTTQPGIVKSDSNRYLLPRTEAARSLRAFTSQFFWPN
jgi:peptidoglycan/xylan/chitin deacetylase (PgdA/CDA1 family)